MKYALRYSVDTPVDTTLRFLLLSLYQLEPERAYETWIAPGKQLPDSLQHLPNPYQEGEMEAYAVSRLMNRRNNIPECIVPLQKSVF